MKAVLVLLAGVLIALPAMAQTDDALKCHAPVGVTAVAIPDGMPQALRETVESTLGDIALPGQSFNATDAGPPGHDRRYLFVWNRGKRWFVATEHGGIAYNDPILEYEIGEDGRTVSLVKTRMAVPQNLCTVATSFIEE
jgi:hypothetical protein